MALSCPKCGGAMIEGFGADKGDYGTASVPQWRAGEPRRSIWVGLKLGKDEALDIATFRCRRCGYLESYATGG